MRVIYLFGLKRIKELPDHDDRRVAGVVVDVREPKLDRFGTHVGQHLNLPAEGLQNPGDDGEMNRRHLRRVERAHARVAALHGAVRDGRAKGGFGHDRNDATLRSPTTVGDGRQERAQANAGGPERVAFVDLQHRREFTRVFEKALHLLGRNGIEPAAEAHELNEFGEGALFHKACRPVEPRMEAPLVDDVKTLGRRGHKVRDGVFGHDLNTHRFDQFGNAVVDQRIHVVGMSGQHDKRLARRLVLAPDRFAFRVKFRAPRVERLTPSTNGALQVPLGNLGEGGLECMDDRCGKFKVEEGGEKLQVREGFLQVEAQRLRVARNNGAREAPGAVGFGGAFHRDAGEPHG